MEVVKVGVEIVIKWNEDDVQRKTNCVAKILMTKPKIFEHFWKIQFVKDCSGKLDKILDVIYRN